MKATLFCLNYNWFPISSSFFPNFLYANDILLLVIFDSLFQLPWVYFWHSEGIFISPLDTAVGRIKHQICSFFVFFVIFPLWFCNTLLPLRNSVSYCGQGLFAYFDFGSNTLPGENHSWRVETISWQIHFKCAEPVECRLGELRRLKMRNLILCGLILSYPWHGLVHAREPVSLWLFDKIIYSWSIATF